MKDNAYELYPHGAREKQSRREFLKKTALTASAPFIGLLGIKQRRHLSQLKSSNAPTPEPVQAPNKKLITAPDEIRGLINETDKTVLEQFRIVSIDDNNDVSE